MGLSNPEARRALRSVVQAILILAMVALVWWTVETKLAGDRQALLELMRYTLGIIGLSTLFYGAENVSRAVRASLGPASFQIGNDDGEER